MPEQHVILSAQLDNVLTLCAAVNRKPRATFQPTEQCYLAKYAMRGVRIVRIATRHTLDGSGFEFRSYQRLFCYSHPSTLPQRPTRPVPGLFPGASSGWAMTLTNHPYLAPRLRMGRPIPLLPLCAFMECHRVNIAFHNEELHILFFV
jgi:hypothetical protein